jgi:peptide/nickel transport system ATP-binding protein
MKPYRKQMQIVFQDPLGSLNPRKTVGEIIKTPLEIHQIGDGDRERVERVKTLLEEVRLKSSHYDRYPHEFSGGQQQRIAIARALTVEPELLIADEPVSALDVSVQAQILELLESLQEKYGLSIFFIAHDLSVVRMIADRVAVMYLGKIVEQGETDAVFESPQHPYTRSLLSAVPKIDPAARGDRQILRGEVPSPIDPPPGCSFHTRCPVIIPPDNWLGTQDQFNELIAFRQRVLRNDDYVTHLRDTVLDAEDPDEHAIVEYIKQEEIGTDWDALPAGTRRDIDAIITRLVHEEPPGTKELFEGFFISPCEQTEPDSYELTPSQTSACFRVTDDDIGD